MGPASFVTLPLNNNLTLYQEIEALSLHSDNNNNRRLSQDS